MTDCWPVGELERVSACPACGGTARRPLYSGLTDRVFGCAPGCWDLHRCPVCGAAYLDPRPTPASIGRAYSQYFTHDGASGPIGLEPQPIPFGNLRLALRNGYLNTAYGYELKPAHWLGRVLMPLFLLSRAREERAIRHMRLTSKGTRLLDLGCGNGRFLRLITSMGWEAIGLDPDPTGVSAARRNGLAVEVGTLEERAYPDSHFDAITMSHVIEHLHDPAATLRECHRVLKPGGVLWMATPNLDGPGHRIFGANWLGLDPPRHLVLFSGSCLEGLIRRAGFERPVAFREPSAALYTFEASARLSKGTGPAGHAGRTGAKFRAAAALADLLGHVMPRRGEELVLVARKT